MAADVVVRFSVPAANPCEAPITPIPAIQGSGATAAITRHASRPVASSSATTRARRRPCAASSSRTPTGDGNPATSDGIFVFEGSNADAVKLGDLVTVTRQRRREPGPVPGQRRHGGHGLRHRLGRPDRGALPRRPAGTALERYEGMLVDAPAGA